MSAALHFDPSVVFEPTDGYTITQNVGDYIPEGAPSPPIRHSHPATSSTPRTSPEWRELKRQREQARRDSKLSARIRRAGRQTSPSIPAKIDFTSMHSMPVYSTAPTEISLLTEPTAPAPWPQIILPPTYLVPRPRREIPTGNALPQGWFMAKDPEGKVYYYSQGGTVTWQRPTVPAHMAKAPSKQQQDQKADMDIIENLSKKPTPQDYSPPLPFSNPMDYTSPYQQPQYMDYSYPPSTGAPLSSHYGPVSYDPAMMYSVPPVIQTGTSGAPHQHNNQGQTRAVQSRPRPQCWEHGCNGRLFTTFSNLLRHQREKAGQATKATCPDCGAEFTRTTARNGHLLHQKCKKERQRANVIEARTRASSQDKFDSAYDLSLSPSRPSPGQPAWAPPPRHPANLSWLLNDDPAPASSAPKRVDEGGPRHKYEKVVSSTTEIHGLPIDHNAYHSPNISSSSATLTAFNNSFKETQPFSQASSQQTHLPMNQSSHDVGDLEFSLAFTGGGQQCDTLFQEATVADSGYVSACASRSINDPKSCEQLRNHDTLEQPGAKSRLTVDQRTVYTSSTLPHGSDYVSDLCNDIYMKLKNELQDHTRDRGRFELPRCLPDLIKAFSVRIGFDTSEPSKAYIMQFLHSNHRNIEAGLRLLCQQREESPEPESRTKDDGGMTVLDRMALWSRKEDEEPASDSQQDCLFEGVRDVEEDDIAENAKMATYRDFVLNSTGYQWFIESLRKQFSLDWGPGFLTDINTCRLIHQSITSRIPSGIISRHRTPEIHRARFQIQMLHDRSHFLGNGQIVNLVTLTSSATNIVQALRLHDYLDQTWSSGGLRLAKLIQKACGGKYEVTHTDKFDDNTWISAELRPERSELPKLLVTVSGSRYSIAECGQQLVWLGAAIQKPVDGQILANCTCRIESQNKMEWCIHYSLDDVQRNMGTIGTQMAPVFRDLTIIQGFPTQKRPPLFVGLELGLALLLECINARWPPVFENGRIVLKGFDRTLEVVKRTQNIWLWHIVHPDSTSCSFSECLSRNEQEISRYSFENGLQIGRLARVARHIIANPEYLGVPVVNPGSSVEKEMGQASAKTEIPGAETREDLGSASSPVEDRSAMDHSEDSLDSDLISSSSEESDLVESLDPEGPLASIIDQISHRIFAQYKESSGFRSRTQCPPTESRGREGNSDNSGNRSESSTTSKSNGIEVCRSGKRSRSHDDDDEHRDNDGFLRPKKRRAQSPTRPQARRLACHFWKLDSHANRNCFHMKLSRIGDIKQHLRRTHEHQASEYCQRCWIAFEDEAHKTAHLSDDSGHICRYNPAARPPGIDSAMSKRLREKSKSEKSIEDQWFAIWDIVCPGQPRPSSAFINDSLTEEASQLQEIIVNNWPSILATELEGALGLAASDDTDRLGREHLIRVTLARLSDDFLAEQARIRADRAAAGHQSPGGQTSSSSAKADSAIEVASHQSNSRSSASSSYGVSRSTPATVIPQLETHAAVRSQSSVVHGRRERYIQPAGQNSFLASYDQQQTSMPPPAIPSRSTIPDLPNVQVTDVHGVDGWIRTDFMDNDPFRLLTEDTAFQNFLGSSEPSVNASWESMEPHAHDWSMPEN